MGDAGGESLASTCEVHLPHITNSVVVSKGDRLYLPKVTKKKKQKQMNWKGQKARARAEAARQSMAAQARLQQWQQASQINENGSLKK